MTGWVEKRSQVIENTLEPGSFFMKLRRPEGVGDKPEATDYGRVADHPLAILSMSALSLFATVDSSRFSPLRTARGFLGTWRRFVDSAGDKAKPSSV